MPLSKTRLLVQIPHHPCAIPRGRPSVGLAQSWLTLARGVIGSRFQNFQHSLMVRKTKVKASILFYTEWSFAFLCHSVGRTILQENQQPRMPFAMSTLDRTISASALLTKVANWDGKSQDVHQVLTVAFEAEDYLDCIKNLQARGIEPLLYINCLDKVCMFLI